MPIADATFEWSQYTIPIFRPGARITGIDILDHLIVDLQHDVHEAMLDWIDGPRLGPGRAEWKKLQPRKVVIVDRRRHVGRPH